MKCLFALVLVGGCAARSEPHIMSNQELNDFLAKNRADHPIVTSPHPEYNRWTAGYKALSAAVVGGSYDNFAGFLLEAPGAWRRMGRTDFGNGRFSESYRINDEYITFSVEDDTFTVVSRR